MTNPPFERAQLNAAMDHYLAALIARNPKQVIWAPDAGYTENNVHLDIGDGLWGTITGLGSYRLLFADTKTGEVGFFGTVLETKDESAFTVRLKINAKTEVSQAEVIVVRLADMNLPFKNPKFYDKPILNAVVVPEHRNSREALIALADGYFSTLQLNDGTIKTKFLPECNRIENGIQTTNNPALKDIHPIAMLGCEAQFKLGNYRYDDRLRGRRYSLVDEERGLVLSFAFIDHSGRLTDYTLTDGRQVKSPFLRPHSFYMAELFKIEDGMIHQIEANFITVPYGMPSPWDSWTK